MTEEPSQILPLTNLQPLLDALVRLYDNDRQVFDRLADRKAFPAVVDAALRGFDGSDWDALARDLAGVSEWSEPVSVVLTPATVEITAVGTVTAHAEVTAVAQHPTADWWSDWLRTRAVLYACLYFTLSTTAEQLWPAHVANLRDNALVAIAIYSAHMASSKREGR